MPIQSDLRDRKRTLCIRLMPKTEMARFALTGLAATALHYLVLTIGVELGGVAPTPMTAIAFLCAVGVSYLGQAFWVFGAKGHDTSQMMRFAVSVLVGLGLNVSIMTVATRILDLDYRLGFAAALLVVPITTFLLNRLWVFAR